VSVKPRKGGLFDRLFGRGEKPAEQELESRQEEAAAPTSDEPLQPAEGKQAEAAAEPAPAEVSVEPQPEQMH